MTAEPGLLISLFAGIAVGVVARLLLRAPLQRRRTRRLLWKFSRKAGMTKKEWRQRRSFW